MSLVVKGNVGKSQRAAFNRHEVLDVPFGIDLHAACLHVEVAVVLIQIAVDDQIAGARLVDKGIQAVICLRSGIGNTRSDAVRVAGCSLLTDGQRGAVRNVERGRPRQP